MKSDHGFRTVAIILAVVAAGVIPCHTLAQQPADAETIAIIQRDLEQRAETLNSPVDSNIEQRDRDEAARQLVSRQSPAARTILLRGLGTGSPTAQLAIVKALAADDHQPDPALVEPLFNALKGPRLVSDAARALVNYNTPAVTNRLIAIVERLPRESESLRAGVVRALGSVLEKHVAQTLVTILRTSDEPESVRQGAGTALKDMTGFTDFGQDAQRWTEWLNRANQKSDADFRAELLFSRAARFEQAHQRLTDLQSGIHDLMLRQYQALSVEQKQEFLLTNLSNAIPDMRVEAARLVEYDAGSEGKTIPEPVKVQLRTMIGDSDPRVREYVARAFTPINEEKSLQALLAQLAQEKEGVVRAELVRAVGTIEKLDAAPTLIEALKDPSLIVATAAARAIETLGPKLKKDAQLASRAAQALKEAFERQRPDVGNSVFREALLNALSPLARSELLESTYYPLLRGNELPPVRRLTIKAIGEIADPKSANTIATAVDDPNANVRVEAVAALGKLSNAYEFYGVLLRHVLEKNEDDSSVRDQAWSVLQSVMPNLPVNQLQDIISQFKNDLTPAVQRKHLLAQKDLEDRFKNQPDELAMLQLNIGYTLMNLKLWPDAAEYFAKSLEYKKTQSNAAAVVSSLREKRIEALLLARQYPDAIAFASQSIAEDKENLISMATAINKEALRLQADKSFDDAVKLIDEALGPKMEPALPPQHQSTLRDLRTEISKQLGPRAGATPAAPTDAQPR